MAYFQDVPHIIEASDIARVESIEVEEVGDVLVAHVTLVLSREGKFAGLHAGDAAPHTLHLTDGNHQWLHTAPVHTTVVRVPAPKAEEKAAESEDASEDAPADVVLAEDAIAARAATDDAPAGDEPETDEPEA